MTSQDNHCDVSEVIFRVFNRRASELLHDCGFEKAVRCYHRHFSANAVCDLLALTNLVRKPIIFEREWTPPRCGTKLKSFQIAHYKR